MADRAETTPRESLNRERVLRAAIALADEVGIDGLSMRKLAGDLGVVPMALYKHVANKDALVDAMVDAVVGDYERPEAGPDWRRNVREQVLSARLVALHHPWLQTAIETRTHRTPVVAEYMNSYTDLFRAGGLSPDLTHHARHALGSRIWGYSAEAFAQPDGAHAGGTEGSPTQAGHVCDAQFEFEFVLDLLLDGLEQLRAQGWSSGTTQRISLRSKGDAVRGRKAGR